MAVLTVQEIDRTSGLEPTYAAAAAAGDSFANDGRTLVHLKNTGTAKTVTVDVAQTVDGQAPADKTYTLDATTGDLMIGPFPPTVYNDANGRVNVTYSSETAVTVAAIRLPS